MPTHFKPQFPLLQNNQDILYLIKSWGKVKIIHASEEQRYGTQEVLKIHSFFPLPHLIPPKPVHIFFKFYCSLVLKLQIITKGVSEF